MRLSDILSNPVRLRIVQYLQIYGDATAKQISEGLGDIPVPTLYRHIGRLVDDGILSVKEERKIRGSTERLLAVNVERWSAETADIADSSYQFLMSLYGRFERYDGDDPAGDRLCLRTCMLRLSDERFDAFLKEYADLLNRYIGSQDGGRLRSVSFVSAPAGEDCDGSKRGRSHRGGRRIAGRDDSVSGQGEKEAGDRNYYGNRQAGQGRERPRKQDEHLPGPV
ncbi:MAG: helix-turn-helix domain-containing protein [Candidatus Methanomethylophilaceae archaeon]|nr:helix-turn-helix domain-containing protein [Candidatus Methanomethylophilaceae archaeon]